MKKILKFVTVLTAFSSLLTAADFEAIVIKGENKLTVNEAEGVLSLKSAGPEALKKKKTSVVSYARRAISEQDGTGNAVSFEFKGDGSDFFASVFLSESKNLVDAHEAIFPLSSTKWQKRVITFEEFARNAKPWNKPKMTEKNIHPIMESLTYMGFGRGFKYHRYNHPDYSFAIRNFKFVQAPKVKNLAIKKGIDAFVGKLANDEPVKILLLGDSITEHGKELSHTYHAMQLLGKKAKVVNAAIGGQTSRGGEIIFERSLRKLPNPDLIVIMYGANDCNNMGEGTGFNDLVFEKHLMNLINKVNHSTNGKCEFLLINGVPRVDKETRISENRVEPLLPAIERVSKQYDLILCDTMSRFLANSKEENDQYYKDGIHQNQEGLKFMGEIIAETIKASLVSGSQNI
ncbi:SGNH/GDSL hydrolase family protein [Lentisphaera profundi]|uniref:SGNH/GDSL hydrolase family protein n=1 Tax=Lentisphaera profundi TaxID=1658616 RepID=A0ABY7VMJ4_9BACT|nr:SGNH/GDSL hydrolase family protein [Lentisphaera profundi]WDE95220.1 SGNH/GDSL hydrolase family protein [Lentisphaera profundi]